MTDDIDDKVCNIKEQYQTMVWDWSHLLHLGLSSDFVGELDRVLWPTLGTGRFLTRWECRYQSLTIGVAPASVAPISKLDTATCRLVAASCYDEKQQALCYMDDSRFVTHLSNTEKLTETAVKTTYGSRYRYGVSTGPRP